MTTRNKPNFWAILPADVRYDKRIIPSAKLLYAELSALSNRHGYAWPSNTHLARLFEVDATSIKRWLSSLEDAGYLRREQHGRTRRLYIRAGAEMPPGAKTPHIGGENAPVEGGENAPHNNTSTNSTRLIPGDDPFLLAVFDAWDKYVSWRRAELGKPYRTSIGEQHAVERLRTLSQGDPDTAREILTACMANRWQGIFKPSNLSTNDRQKELRSAVEAADRAGLLD